MATTRIRNGLIQTPTGPVEADVLVDGERISALLARDSEVSADSEIDATGLWVLPGLIDLHAHTRVPGYEYKEDFLHVVESGCGRRLHDVCGYAERRASDYDCRAFRAKASAGCNTVHHRLGSFRGTGSA